MSYTYIEAPELIPLLERESIFLAGGITGVEDWQSRAVEVLRGFGDITILNPRRKVWNEKASEEEVKLQVAWERIGLLLATQVIFWFGKETVQPIALFELGCRLTDNVWKSVVQSKCQQLAIQPKCPPQALFIGCHPEYSRKLDLQIQLPLSGYDKPLVFDLDTLLQQVLEYNRQLQLVR